MDLTPISMAGHDMLPFSSQETMYLEKENVDPVLSSPLKPVGSRPKRPPTVTPKRFSRFFTPRSSLSSKNSRPSKSARALKNISSQANRRFDLNYQQPEHDFPSSRSPKRRKYADDLYSSPPQSSPIKYAHASPLKQVHISEDVHVDFSEDDELPGYPEQDIEQYRQLRTNSTSLQLLTRSFGSGARRIHERFITERSTADYCSTPEDILDLQSPQPSLPFCTQACNTNSLIAIGDEDGLVHLVDTAQGAKFSKAHLSFRVHSNAIMDMAFSPCDHILATAGGDQTSRIVDMQTQQVLSVLSGHKTSVKQIRFRPGDNKLITTSGRDGLINVWDLRCSQRAVQSCQVTWAVDDPFPMALCPYASMLAGPAHRITRATDKVLRPADAYAIDSTSITSIEHLPGSRSHLLLSASEQNGSLKLFDLRIAGRTTSRHGYEVPVSCTAPPANQRRNYGVSALKLSTDGSRAYSICRDNTVWAYSTQHLIMGSAADASTVSRRTRSALPDRTKEGLAPLYGMRHPELRINSFFIRAALRQSSAQHSEALAVGSQNSCAVLFDTNEARLFSTAQRHYDNGVLIFEDQGAALVRGHSKDVTTLAFAHEGGELVTSGDDYLARCWRQDADKARHLRQCGEGEGQRWLSGWAEASAAYDEEE